MVNQAASRAEDNRAEDNRAVVSQAANLTVDRRADHKALAAVTVDLRAAVVKWAVCQAAAVVTEIQQVLALGPKLRAAVAIKPVPTVMETETVTANPLVSAAIPARYPAE